MAASKGGRGKAAAGSSKPAAARREKTAEKETVDFLGLTIEVPEKLPGTILFDIADLEMGRDLGGTMEFIKSLVGEDTFRAIRQRVADKGIELEEVPGKLIDLLEEILEKAGLSLGES
jgi:hypothetical protein